MADPRIIAWFTCGCDACKPQPHDRQFVAREWRRRALVLHGPLPPALKAMWNVGMARLTEDACAALPAGSEVFYSQRDSYEVDAITRLGELA